MICSEFFELLDNYESLTDEQRNEMENHAAECETCRNELEFFKSVISNLESIPSPKAPETLIDKVNAKLDAEKTTVVGFRWNFRVLSTVAACLAIGLAVGINNGYIKDAITDSGTDGVISESVVKTTDEEENTPVVESVEEVEPVEETVASAPVVATQKPVKVTAQTTQTQAPAKTVATAAPVNAVAPAAESTEKPVQTAAPAATPDNTHDVDDYAIKDDETQITYGYYNVERNVKTPSAISDYLHVESNDMGTVVSTMSEMGFRYSSGYYMTSRQNFYEFINRLDDEGVGYSCDLRYNSGDNISFRLTYN